MQMRMLITSMCRGTTRSVICKELVVHLPVHSSSKILQVTTFTRLAVQ